MHLTVHEEWYSIKTADIWQRIWRLFELGRDKVHGEVGKGGNVGALGSNAQGNHALRPDDNHHLDDMRLLRELMQDILEQGNATHKTE